MNVQFWNGYGVEWKGLWKNKPTNPKELAGGDPPGCIWFLYSGSNTTGRTNYKWNAPPSPLPSDASYHEELADMIRNMSERNSGDISYVSFAATTEPTPNCIFMRSTDQHNNWRYRWSIGSLPPTCERELQAKIIGGMKYDKVEGDSVWVGGRIRAITFGYNDSWILYGQSSFAYGGQLPEDLQDGLRTGKLKGWTINVSKFATQYRLPI
jgi:hypothetical protein